MFQIEQFICIKMDLGLNNLQRLICHKTRTNKKKKRISKLCHIWSVINPPSEIMTTIYCCNVLYIYILSNADRLFRLGDMDASNWDGNLADFTDILTQSYHDSKRKRRNFSRVCVCVCVCIKQYLVLNIQ